MSTADSLEQADPLTEVDDDVEMAGIRGRLDEIGLPSLLCILEMERKTGILLLILEPELEKATLHLREGRVCRAHLSRREPRNAAAVYALFACTRGTFDFHPSDEIFGDDIQCSTSRLIFEGARRLEEARFAPPLEAVEYAPIEPDPVSRPSRKKARFVPDLKRAPQRTTLGRRTVAVLLMASFVLVLVSAVWCSV